MIDELKEVQYR